VRGSCPSRAIANASLLAALLKRIVALLSTAFDTTAFDTTLARSQDIQHVAQMVEIASDELPWIPSTSAGASRRK
jgi:hypothetical protein